MSTPEDIPEDSGIISGAIRRSSSIDNDNSDPSIPVSYNPTLTVDDLTEDFLERLKGDAIGNTLYSERFVLKTLLKIGQLSKSLDDEEELEQDLCSLWDMTVEEDVVKYLLNQNFLDLFACIISITEDKRLTEILVGIVGNMCSVQETIDQLTEREEVIKILLDLVGCVDSFTLQQFMRLINVIFANISLEQAEKWYNIILRSENFVENLCFILNYATNNTLVLQTLESLGSILTRYFNVKCSYVGDSTIFDKIKKGKFERLFVQVQVVESTVEALNSLTKETTDQQDSFETFEIPVNIRKAKIAFCKIHNILAQSGALSIKAYKTRNDEILKCFKDILQLSDESYSINTWMRRHQDDFVATLYNVLKVLPKPFDFDIFKYLLKLYYDLSIEEEKDLNEDDDYEMDDDRLFLKIPTLSSLYYLVFKTDKEELKQCIQMSPSKYSLKLLESFEHPLENEYYQNCFQKLKEVLDK